jgi:hypothetical protein
LKGSPLKGDRVAANDAAAEEFVKSISLHCERLPLLDSHEKNGWINL